MKRYLSIMIAMLLCLILSTAEMFAAAPTIQARYVAFTNITNASARVNWLNGNGARRIVVISTDNTWETLVNGTNYVTAVDNTLGGADQIGTSNDYVISAVSGTTRTVDISGLASGVTYYIRVYEYNGTGLNIEYCTGTGTNNPRSFTTVLAAPTIAAETSVGNDNFTINWNAVSGADSYELDISTGTGGAFDAGMLTAYTDLDLASNATSFDVSGLNPSTTYYYRLRAVKGNATSANSLEDNQATTANGDPTVTAQASVTFTEGSAVAVDATLLVADPDNVGDDFDFITGATVTITDAIANDVLSATGNDDISVNWVTPTLTLTGTASVQAYQEVLRTVTFNHTTDNPDNYGTDLTRTVRFNVTDEHAGTSVNEDVTVNVDDVNDATVIAGNNNAPSFTENGSAVVIDNSLTFTDADDQNYNGGNLTVSITSAEANDGLGLAADNMYRNNAGTIQYDVDNDGLWNGSEVAIGTVDGTNNGTNGSLTINLNANATVAIAEGLAEHIAFVSTADKFASTTRTINFVLTDRAAGDARDAGVASNTAAITLTIVPVNDAPTLTQVANLPTIDEDANPNDGILVTDLISTYMADPDVSPLTDANKGLALVGVDETDGQIEYTLNGGTNWISIDHTTIANTAAIVLYSNANTKVRFVPNANYNGTSNDVVRFVAYDRTNDGVYTNGSTVDITADVDNRFSGIFRWSNIVVNAVNDAPVLVPGDLQIFSNIDEDDQSNAGDLVSYLLTDLGDAVTDVDAGAVEGIAVYSETSPGGKWQYNLGASWVDFPALTTSAALLLNNDGDTKIRFVPDADYNNVAGTDNYINFKAWDRTSGTEGNTADVTTNGGTTAFSTVNSGVVNIAIDPVNDAPVLTAGLVTNFTSIVEDVADGANTGNLVSALLATAVADVDAAPLKGIAIYNSATANGKFQYALDNGGGYDPWVDIAADGSITTANALLLRSVDKVRFVPNANYYGTGNKIQYYAWDQTVGAQTNLVNATVRGTTTAYSTASAQALIVVTSVDDAPVFTDYTAGTVSYTENGAAISLDQGGDAQINDVEENYTNGKITVSVSANGDANDVLAVKTAGNFTVAVNGLNKEISYTGFGVIGSYPVSGAGSGTAGSDLVITLSQNGISSVLTEMLQANLVYSSTSDYFATGSKTVTVIASTDSPAFAINSATQSITVNLTNVNDTPTDIAAAGTTVAENSANGTVAATFSTTDADTPDTHTYTLVAGAGSTNNGSFIIAGNQLQVNAPIDFETTPTLSVRVRTTDNGTGNLWYEEAFTITVTNVNEAPTDITLSANTINENSANATVIATLTTTDVDAGDTFTYSLVAGAGDTDNGLVTLVGNSLQVNGAIDFETNPTLELRIRTTDFGGLTYDEQVVITVLDLNETPTDITLSANAVNENVAGNTVVGTMTTTDVDAGNTFTYTLVAGIGADDNAAFNINGNELRITNSPNFEVKNSYTVRVRTTDQGALYYEEAFAITINDLNEAPILAAIGAQSTNEDVAKNITINFTDEDPADTHTITVTSDNGNVVVSGAGNTSGSTRTLTPALNWYGTANITVTVTDNGAGNLNDQEIFVLTVNSVNDAPTISVADGAYTENDGATTIDGAATVTNPEDDWTGGTLTVSITSPNATEDITILDDGPGAGNIDVDLFEINDNLTTFATFTGGTNGTNLVINFNVNATTALVQKLVRHLQYSDATNNNPDPSRSLTYTVVDAGALTGSDNSTLVVISASNDAPTVANVEVGALAYTENAAATAITSTLTIADPDDTNIESATIQITGNYQNGQDVLAFTNQNGITGIWTAGTGTMALSGSATLANYQTAIRSITYQNTSDNPSTALRTVTFIVNDGTDPSIAVTRDINVTAVNDAPVLAGAVNFTSVTEDDAAPAGNTVGSLIAAQITDPDGPAAGIVVTAKTGNGTWEYTINNGTNWFDIGAVTTSTARFLLDNPNTKVRFVPNPAVNNAQTATLTFRACDNYSNNVNAAFGLDVTTFGGSTDFSTASATASISVTAVNDAPVWTDGNKGAFASILEDNTNSAGTLVSTLIGTAISDVDNAAQAGVAITAVDNANGTWEYTTNGTVWNSIAPVAPGSALLLTNDANRAIRFVPAANYNGTANITLVAWDRTSGAEGNKVDETYSATSAFSSASGTFTLTVTAVNDIPTLDNLAVLNINEDAGLQTVNLAGISEGPANEAAGQALVVTATSDNLSLIPNPTVVYTPDNATGSITFTPVANANGSAIITVTVTDDGGTANGGVNTVSKTFTVNVAAVNDEPTLTTVNALNGATEDQSFTVTYATLAAAADEADIDGPAPTQFRIEAVSTGTLTKNGNPIVAGTTTLTTGEQLVWTPVANANGALNAFTVVAYDGSLPSAPAIQVVVNTTAVNDAPVLTTINTANFTNINEDDAAPAGTLISDILNTGVTDVDAAAVEGMAIYAANNANGQWQYSLNGGANWTNIAGVSSSSALLLGADAGQLIRFVPTANYSGFSSITYYAWDQSVGAQATTTSVGTRGGTTAFSTQGTTAQITINPINDPPTFATMNPETLCVDNGLRTYAISGTTGVGESTQNQVISTITATSDNQVLIPNASISVTGLSTDGSGNWSATLNYTPAAGQSGSATISITAVDDGGNVPDNDDTEIATLSVVINPIPVLAITPPAPVTYPTTVDLSAPAIVAGTTNATSFEYYPTLLDAQNSTNQLGSPIISGAANSGTYYIKAINACGNDIESVAVTINKKVLDVTADNKTREYGDANPALTITYSGFAGVETAAVLDVAPTATTVATPTSAVNTYNIVPAGGSDDNYSFNYINGTLTITKATLTVDADDKSKTYGAADPAFTVTYTGFKNGEVLGTSGVAGSPAVTRAAGENVSTYTITPAVGTLTSGNYNFNFTTGTLTINKATLTATADNKSKIYGAVNPAFTISYAGFQFGETSAVIDVPPTATSVATAASPVNTYSIVPAGGSDNNYDFSYVNGTLTINKATLIVDADDKSKTYGAADPAFTVTYTGFVNGEVLGTSGVTGAPSVTRAAGETVNTYTITPALGTLASSNYDFSFTTGTLTIGKATLTATADNKTKTYGDANPAFTITYTGFQFGETSAVINVLGTATCGAVANSPVNTYSIVPAGASDDNYDFTYVNGTLTVNKKTLQAAAFNASKTYGAANPGFTIGYTGFILGENELVIDVLPTATTTATVLSPVNTYPISVAGGSDNNYDFTYVPGTLTVNKATLTVDADDKSKTYGTADPAFTVTFTGFQNGEVLGTSGVTGSASVTRAAGENAGSYTITPALGTLAASNYDFTFTTGTLTIDKANQTITFNALPAKTTADADFNPGATASSGLTVSYSSDNLAVATIVGGNIHIVGAGSATITASQAGDGNYNPALSVDQTLTVTSVTIPIITGDPANTTQCGTGSASFSVTSVAGSPVPTLEWQVSTNGGGTWAAVAGGDYTGQGTITLNVSNLTGKDGYQYKLVATNNQGTDESLAATLTVTAPSTPTVAIVSNDVDNTFCSGTNVTFTASPNNIGGGIVAYQWKKNGGNVGLNQNTYSANDLLNGDVVSCEITVVGGCVTTTTALSNNITNTVYATTAINTHPSPVAVNAGQTANFSVTATGANLTYQWRRNNVNLVEGGFITGSNSANLAVANCGAGDAGNYDCVVTGSCGNATSNTAALSVTVPPTKLTLQAVGTQTSGVAFNVVVETRDNTNTLQPVTSNTAVTFAVATGTGTLTGSGTITAGNSSATISVTYTKVSGETGVSLTASATGLTSATTNTFNVNAAEPTTQASNINWTNWTKNEISFTWKPGSGPGTLVLAKKNATTIVDVPTDFVNYTANPVYGTLGTGIGTSFVVYKGTDSTLTVTGLDSNTRYCFRLFSYNGTGTLSNFSTSTVGTYVQRNRYTLLKDGANSEITNVVLNSSNVTPNPAKESAVVTIELSERTQVSVLVFDAAGRKVLSAADGLTLDAGTHNIKLDLNNISNGAYGVLIGAGDEVIYHNLMISK